MARAKAKRTKSTSRKPVAKAPAQKVPPRLQDALGIDNLLTAGAASPQEVDEVLSLLREQAEHEIEKLIAFVDRIAPDPDLEPSLGYNPFGGDDREGDDADAEPSLGSIDVHPSGYTTQNELRGLTNQENWAAGNRDDAEGDEHDGSEPDVDDEEDDAGEDDGTTLEPSLGSFERLENQEHAWKQRGHWLPTDGENAAEAPTGELDRQRAAYKAKHKHPYNGVGGVIIPLRR